MVPRKRYIKVSPMGSLEGQNNRSLPSGQPTINISHLSLNSHTQTRCPPRPLLSSVSRATRYVLSPLPPSPQKTNQHQGSSVANVFLNEPGWHVRGITRDPSKPSSKTWTDKGVELVAGDLDDLSTLRAAFANADVIFGVTDFWQHMKDPAVHKLAAERNITPNEIAYEREVAQGRSIVDAAAANVETIERFVLSTVNSSKEWSKGKITFNLHFDAKWVAVEYCREKYPELWKKTSLLQLGVFASNWKQGMVPKKQDDGTYKLSVPMGADRKLPMVDPNEDTGGCPFASLPYPGH